MVTGSKRKCKNCDNEANPQLGTGLFCSRSCSSARLENREKINKKISAALKGRMPACSHPKAREKAKITRRAAYQTKIETCDFDKLSRCGKRKRIFLEQNSKCNACNLKEWMGIKITFELDHIDGDTSNNDRENLRMLCPNCHAQTPTWRRQKTSLKK